MIECLGCYKQVLSLAPTFLDASIYGSSQCLIVLIIYGTIDVPISDLKGSLQDSQYFLIVCDVVAAQPNQRQYLLVRQQLRRRPSLLFLFLIH